MKLSLPSVAIGAAIAAVPTVLIRIAVVGPVHVAGVPTAEDIVNINFANFPTQQPGQAKVPLFEVPSGRSLVLTGCTASAAGILYETRGQQSTALVDLSGVRFITGSYSAVALAGVSPFPIVVRGGSTLECDYVPQTPSISITGYLE